MAVPLATNLLHFHLNKKLFINIFVLWHYLAWPLFWILFKKMGNFFPNHLVTLTAAQLTRSSYSSKSLHPVLIRLELTRVKPLQDSALRRSSQHCWQLTRLKMASCKFLLFTITINYCCKKFYNTGSRMFLCWTGHLSFQVQGLIS